MAKPGLTSREASIKKILLKGFKNEKTKISPQAFKCFIQALTCVMIESGMRTAKQTILENKTVVEVEDVWKILPQLMLDMP